MISYSIVIPVKDEAESIPTLYKEIKEVFDKLNRQYEIIFIDDGSTDKSSHIISTLQKTDRNINLVKFRANFGKSKALSAGFSETKGELIIIMDADLQDDPRDVLKLLTKIDDGYDLVSGWRKNRADSLTKRVSSYLFNRGTSFISGVKIHDFNCGLKAFKKEVADELFLHGELHRFIPVLAKKRKFKVTEIEVNNRPRKFGESKFGKLGIARGWKGMLDLLTAIFITDYLDKPAHFFGAIGLSFFSIGFLMDLYVSYIKLTTGTTQGRLPLLLAGVLFILLGIQLISTGLIAEMMSHYLSLRKKSSLR
ncbi:MAG: glycosyltransferase family 2 protein [Candidatus Levyibacteriota bacterium]